MGSEMCIRDRHGPGGLAQLDAHLVRDDVRERGLAEAGRAEDQTVICLLYTSDAADELDGVDLGGRRIIKKKKR